MAGYGLLRINIGFFQETQGFTVHDTAWILAILAAVSTLYGAVVTIRQTDMKRLIAFSSISHMGFVVLGVSAIAGSSGAAAGGLNGAAMQMFTHGTITGLAFLVVGLVYDPGPHAVHPAPGRVVAEDAGDRRLLPARRLRLTGPPRH